MMITDAQMHIWEVDRPDRPWPATARNEPQLPNGFGVDEALAAMDGAGVDRAVIVPPTWVGEGNLTALEAAAANPERFAVMGRFDPAGLDAANRLTGWLDTPHMLGIRMTFRTEPFATWLADGSLEWFWATSERLGIPLMVQLGGILDKARPIAERHPGLTLIVDHFGWDARAADPFAGMDDLIALASFPNVYVKATGAPECSRRPFPFEDLEPHIRRVFDAYGPRRMMWGADLTRLKCTYDEVLRHFSETLDFLSEEDKEWILGRTAAEVLRWPEPAESAVRHG